MWEPQVLEQVKKIFPTNRIERFGDVEFKEKSGGPVPVVASRGCPDRHEVVMYASCFDECGLALRHDEGHVFL